MTLAHASNPDGVPRVMPCDTRRKGTPSCPHRSSPAPSPRWPSPRGSSGIAAGPAHAGTFVGNPGDAPGVACDGIGAIVYNGHAGVGANGFVVQNGKASPGVS